MQRPTMGSLAERWLSTDLADRVRHLRLRDEGHGYDRFGMHADGVAFALSVTRPLYERWFRVTSHDVHHANKARPAVLAANHSGMLPFDAMMIWTDLARHSDPPWVPRVVIDHFVNEMPFVSILFARAGAIGGSRGNFQEVLGRGDSVLVFPEGVPGISKPYAHRYQLQKWREGHAELAIRHGVPIVPVAVIGAEEQLPPLVNLPIQAFGAPFLPIPMTPVPLPVHYHIYYGAPINVHQQYKPAEARDPAAVAHAAALVRTAVEGLIARGLEEREGVFK